ncbi:thioredoxin domain-containing protein [Bifidobacterium sp. ESL0775]|uniref:DsbA family protein n=1 Tax=Bifidobacterium sp. ESL0775 TaxID=2983230 RepID=UPI0023F7C67B|nr:thioredoxin domain-containing protein [Bifidobacterium sp. ESL0775]WEV69887.1 thioredoxin domain-containing protein [Bifidobacterium sp. ESL0775]
MVDNGDEKDAQQPNEVDTDDISTTQANNTTGAPTAKLTQETSHTNKVDHSSPETSETATKTDEKKQKHLTLTIFGIIAAVLVVVIVAVVGYGYWDKQHAEERAYQQLQGLTQKPEGMNKQGGLPAFKASDFNPKAPSVDLYVDYFCPDCADLDHDTAPTLKKLAEARQINLYLHPVNFLDAKTKNHYSTRAAGVAAYISSHEPDKLLDFTSSMYDTDFHHQSLDGKNVTDQQIIDQALKAGVSKQVASAATNGSYTDYVQRATKYTLLRKDLFVDVRGEHRFSSPTITINGTMWKYRAMQKLENVSSALIQVIGLNERDVGNPQVTPSIGAHGQVGAIAKQYL